MGVHGDLARDDLFDGAVLIDHERDPFHLQEIERPLDVVVASDVAVDVSENWIVEAVLLGELCQAIGAVHGDAHPLGPERLELTLEVTEVTGLPGAAVAHRGGEEEQHDRSVTEHGRQVPLVPVLIGQGEVIRQIVFLHDVRLRVQSKADASNGDEMTWRRRVGLDFLAQTLDVGVEGSGVGEFESPPQRVETDFAGHHLAESRGEERQQVELFTTELHLSVVARDRTPGEVDAEVAEADDLVVTRRLGASQHGADARDELTQAVRLGDVVGRANLEPQDDVDFAGARGDHDDRDVGGVVEFSAVVNARAVGQHHVEQHEVGLGREQERARLGDIGRTDHHEALDAESDVERVLVTLLILDDEDDVATWHVERGAHARRFTSRGVARTGSARGL